MKFTTRSVATVICTVAAAVGLFVNTSVGLPVHLAGGSVLAMGGNSNPQGVKMESELNGFISTEPETPYAGYEFSVVVWSAQIPLTTGATGMTYDESQVEGLDAISDAVSKTYIAGEPLLVVGYSSSAAVITKYLRQLHVGTANPTPLPADLSFILIGNPNRPNGGIIARFPGLRIGPPFGATFDGATPVTAYTVTDISWQYDGISDFPNYTANTLAVVNALMGFLTLHGQYYPADPTDSGQIVSDVTMGSTRYITLRADLPLLAPLYLLGVPRPLLADLDAALRVQVERGYDRSISPDAATPAQFLPSRVPAAPSVTSTPFVGATSDLQGSGAEATDPDPGSAEHSGEAPAPISSAPDPVKTTATATSTGAGADSDPAAAQTSSIEPSPTMSSIESTDTDSQSTAPTSNAGTPRPPTTTPSAETSDDTTSPIPAGAVPEAA